MEYRINFLLSALTAVGNLVGGVYALWLLFRKNPVIGGWEWDQALMVVGTFTMLEGVTSAWLSPNLSRIVDHVRKGTLDFILLKPVDSQFWLSLRNFSPWGIPNILLGVCIMVYSGWRLNLGFGSVAMGLAPLGLGLVILYSLWFILGSTSIWFVKIYNITEVLRNLLTAGRFPIQVYSAGYRFFFTFVVPVAFLTTFPAEVMLGRTGQDASTPWGLHAGLPVAALLAGTLLVASRLFWRLALRFYTSASS